MICAGAPGSAVALIVTDVAGEDATVSACAPARMLSVQLPTVAVPTASVVALPPVTDPPPSDTENVTGVPAATGLLNASVTLTLGATATAVLTVADWLLPARIVIVLAAPAI